MSLFNLYLSLVDIGYKVSETKLRNSQYTKVIHSEIRPIADSDRKEFIDFLARYGFSPGSKDVFDYYVSVENTTPFAVRVSGRIIGTGMSYSMGETGWIGAICVDENYRRVGFGRQLTEYAVDRLRDQGCTTVLLRASDTGAQLYESMGFRRTGRYENFFAPEGGWRIPMVHNGRIREFSSIQSKHIAMESEMSGEDKSPYLKSISPTTGIEVIQDGVMVGFASPSVGGGIIGATYEESLIPSLMAAVSWGKMYKIRTLVGSRSNEYLHSLGFETRDGAIRMALGNDPLKKKRNLVGTVSSSIG